MFTDSLTEYEADLTNMVIRNEVKNDKCRSRWLCSYRDVGLP